MNLRTTIPAILLVLLCALPALSQDKQERGFWKPASTNAKSITGELTLNVEKLTINFLGIPIAQIRTLAPAEVSAAFETADAAAGTGHLYRLSIPGDRRFLHKNTLCGSDETQWMATFVSGKDLQIAFFSNANPPVFTPEALSNNVNLCGTFSYTR